MSDEPMRGYVGQARGAALVEPPRIDLALLDLTAPLLDAGPVMMPAPRKGPEKPVRPPIVWRGRGRKP